MNVIKIALIISILGGVAVFVTGMITMPPSNGGTVPLNQTQEQYNQEQHAAVIQSSGFKMAISGSAISIFAICLLVYYRMKEDEEIFRKENRRMQIVPVASPMPVASPTEIVVVGPEAHLPMASPMTPMATPMTQKPIFHELKPPPRTFKYPPPYDVLNKK